VNLVTVTKMNMIGRNALWLCKNHCCETMAPCLPQCSSEVSAALEVSRRAAQRSQQIRKSSADRRRCLRRRNILPFYKWNFVASWMPLHNCRCFQEPLRMLLQSLRAHCVAPGRSWSIWKYLEALVWLPRVSGRVACCFQTNFHFGDVRLPSARLQMQKTLP